MKRKLFSFFVILVFTQTVFAQSLKGEVIDSDGNGIPFAKVRVENTSYGTVANAMGKYVIELKKGKYTIQVSAPGYTQLIDTVTVSELFTTKDFKLFPLIQEIGEVMIVAQSKKERGKQIMKQVIDKRSFFMIKFLNIHAILIALVH